MPPTSTPKTPETSKPSHVALFREGRFFALFTFCTAKAREEFVDVTPLGAAFYRLPEETRAMTSCEKEEEVAQALTMLQQGAGSSAVIDQALTPVHTALADAKQLLSLYMAKTDRPLIEYLVLAAAAFAREAKKRAEAEGEVETDAPLTLDHTEAFKGLVILAAMEFFPGDPPAERLKKAFIALGKEATVRGRNHWATYEREFEHTQTLRSALGLERQEPISSKNGQR